MLVLKRKKWVMLHICLESKDQKDDPEIKFIIVLEPKDLKEDLRIDLDHLVHLKEQRKIKNDFLVIVAFILIRSADKKEI